MTKDIELINEVLKTPFLNGAALLRQVGIDETKIEKISNNRDVLSSAENLLLSILSKNPEVLNGCGERFSDLTFSISSKIKATQSIDQLVQDLIDDLNKECTKSGLTKEEFSSGNRNNNPHRRRVNEFFQSLAEKDLIGKDAARCYQTPLWKSFKTGEPFRRGNFGNH